MRPPPTTRWAEFGPAAAPGLVASVRRPIARSRPRAMPSNETSDSRSAGISCDRESVST
jgi:hypothetical protein